MADTKQAIQHHERGMGHQGNVQRKLRDMTRKADQEKRDAANLSASMAKIEAAANRQYQSDLLSASLTSTMAGIWKWDAQTSLYYIAVHDLYYDPKSKYYGVKGEWTLDPPSLPLVARFGTAPHEGGPVPELPPSSSLAQKGASSASAAQQGSSASALVARRLAVGSGGGGGVGGAGVSTSNHVKGMSGIDTVRTKTSVVTLPSHPLANIGGHAGPTMGRVGAAKGLTDLSSDSKRKREEEGIKAGGKGGPPTAPMSAEEASAHARREAARQRVALRTAQGYGFA
jgi:WW domain-binding protein 4